MKKYISIVICLVFMAIIFFNSGMNGYISNYYSYSIVKGLSGSNGKKQAPMVKKPKKDLNPALSGTKAEQKLNIVLRKYAHGLEYLILSVLLIICFKMFGKALEDNIINILFICLLYAITDEYHQIFIPGRRSSVTDITIDFMGACIGVLFVYIEKSIFRRKAQIKN